MPDDQGLMGVGGADGADGGTQPPQQQSQTPPAGQQPTKAERPDYIPEQFWDPEKGAPRVDAMAKSWNDTRKALNEATKASKGKAPETPEGYLDDWTVPREMGEGDDAKKLERIKEISADDPALQAMAQAAHKHGLTDKQFRGMLTEVLYSVDGLMPEPFDLEREIEALGTGSRDEALHLIGQNRDWLTRLHDQGVLGEDHFEFAKQFASSALGLQTLNLLREQAGEKPIPVNTLSLNEGRKTEAELISMMNDPRYHDGGPVGDAFRAEVERGYEALHPQRRR
jgi:hypothetical protein